MSQSISKGKNVRGVAAGADIAPPVTQLELASHLPSTPAPIEGAATTRTRKPFGSQHQKLAYPERAGYRRHWFNDTPGRIMLAEGAGWDHVKDDKTGQKVSRPVDSNGTSGYLMETPQEWYEQDMAAQQAIVDETDAAIRGGAVAGAPGEDGRYIPSRGIKVSTRPS